MMRILSRVLLVASLGCGSTVVTPGPTPDGGAVCRFPDGTQCRQGQSCPSPDGCNTCSCGADGLLACTLRACVDGGPDVGATCQSSADCPPSTMCQGAMGCGVAWRCVPLTGCTPDLTRFCACDGTTFEGSSSCPGRPYRAFGACPAADGGVACAAMDARGEGACDGYFGVAWNGADCVGLTGCRCVGADCGRAFRDRAACVAACVR
jgi:hypothetical protein